MNKEKDILGIDLDDVTADLNTKALEYRNLDNPNDILDLSDLHCWKGNWDLLSKYYLQKGIYKELDVIEGSQEVLKELSKEYKIIFITASPSIQATVEKLEWVDEHFPFIGSENVIPTRHKYLINTNLLFDDSPEFISKFKGIKVLMDRIHNQKLSSNNYDARVKDWYEFLEVVRGLEKEGKLTSYSYK